MQYTLWYINAGVLLLFFFFQAEDGIRDFHVTGVQTCALPISGATGAQGPQGNTGATGVTGPQGPSGVTTLVVQIPFSSNGNCPYGGTEVQSGLDSNGNGILDASEVSSDTFVCNCAPGATG